MKDRLKKITKIIVLGLSLWLFYHVLESVGFETIKNSFKNVSWVGILCIFLYPGTWRIFQSYSFYLASDIKGSKKLDFYKAQVASLFVGDIFPFGGLGGEAYRVYYLNQKYPDKLSHLVAGITLYNILALFVLFLFFVVSIIYLVIVYPLPTLFKVTSLSLVGILCGIFLAVFILQKKGLFGQVLALFGKIPKMTPYVLKAQEKMMWVDKVISDFFKSDHKRFLKVLGSLIVVRILGIIEILMISYFVVDLLSLEQTVWLVLADAFVQTFLFFLPGGQIGVLESVVNKAGVLIAIPFVSIGIISIFKRLRTIVWAFIGFLIIIFSKAGLNLKGSKKNS